MKRSGRDTERGGGQKEKERERAREWENTETGFLNSGPIIICGTLHLAEVPEHMGNPNQHTRRRRAPLNKRKSFNVHNKQQTLSTHRK